MSKVLRLMMLSLLFLVYLPPASAREPMKKDSVWVMLGVHGSPQLAPQFMQAYADESSERIERELKHAGIDRRRPLVIWFERVVPMSLFYSFNDPANFYAELAARAGVQLNSIPALLLDPAAPAAQVKKVEKTLREIFDEHETRFEKEGGETFVMPDVFRDWLRYLKQLRPVAARYEKSSFEAWLISLKSNFWASGMAENLVKGEIEAALASDIRYNVLFHQSNAVRDRSLADWIAADLGARSDTLHIVILGASHDRLAAFLNRRGILSRNIQQFDFRSASSTADYFMSYEVRPELFTASFRLTDEERDYASLDLIEQLAAFHLLSQGLEIFYRSPVHAPLKELLSRLNGRELGEWRRLMSVQEGDFGKKAQVTWTWLTSKDPRLEKQFLL